MTLDDEIKIKPCELSLIKKEEELLKQYYNDDIKFKDIYVYDASA
jgi:hypothetical protein